MYIVEPNEAEQQSATERRRPIEHEGLNLLEWGLRIVRSTFELEATRPMVCNENLGATEQEWEKERERENGRKRESDKEKKREDILPDGGNKNKSVDIRVLC